MSNMQLTVVLKTLSKTITITLALFFSFSLVSLNSFADANNIPNKGMTQSEVKTNFGEPINTKAPIGNPPIERWDYPNYSVYFEGSYVIHSFFHNQRKQAVTPQVVTNTTETITVEQVPVEPASEAKADVMTEEKLENAAAQEEPVVEEVQVAEPMTEQTSEAAQQAGEATEAEAEAEMVEEAEKDLNFEEAETKTDYGKWGY